MQLEVGSIVEGKVTRHNKSSARLSNCREVGPVCDISLRWRRAYVKEIKDHISENQMVKVKILNIGEDRKGKFVDQACHG